MSTPPPAFGPTDPIPCDDDHEAFATVRLDLVVSREQLRAALAIGHAEQAGQPPLHELDILDVRREVEGYLAAAAVIGTDQEAATARISPELAAELDAAIDRAYTRREPRPDQPQDPRYGDGTVTLQTLDHGEVTVGEPAWCTGHDDDTVGRFADLTHNGPAITATAVTAEHGQLEVMRGFISHAPHGVQQREPHPTLYVALDLHESFGPEDGRHLTRALRVASTRIDRALAEVARLRGEGR
ncbi:DUF6907 domain-containing protein [Streptomyces sp. NPDC058678]|uniref:DUF6907 domain-containing protein n=1 Tax=Streptomyces sp. NPDC058678 TaxID=3346595 RepID=UPI003654BB13